MTKRLLLATFLAFAASPALAHPNHDVGLAAGLIHPLTGADHLLAMATVGLWAALRGGKALWSWPAAFVTAMLAGYGLRTTGLSLPLIEPTILASVIVLGVLAAAAARAPTIAGAGLIALFGLAHGYAHGAEAPAAAGLAFPFGFVAATAGLHLIGLAAGRGLVALHRPIVARLMGAGAAIGGLALALS